MVAHSRKKQPNRCLICWTCLASMQENNGSMIIPMLIALLDVVLFIYQYVTANQNAFLLQFMGLSTLQVMPLVLIKWKTLNCQDRMPLLSRFTTKVLLMHSAFLTLRSVVFFFVNVSAQDVGEGGEWFSAACDIAANLVANVILVLAFNFWPNLAGIKDQRDLFFIILMAFLLSVVVNKQQGNGSSMIIPTMTNNVETLAFMPAVSLLYSMNRNVEVFAPMPEKETWNQSLWFLLFVVVYYFHDDMVCTTSALTEFPIIYACHTLHFIMLLDHCAFFLFQAWAPPKAKLEDAAFTEKDMETMADLNIDSNVFE